MVLGAFNPSPIVWTVIRCLTSAGIATVTLDLMGTAYYTGSAELIKMPPSVSTAHILWFDFNPWEAFSEGGVS